MSCPSEGIDGLVTAAKGLANATITFDGKRTSAWWAALPVVGAVATLALLLCALRWRARRHGAGCWAALDQRISRLGIKAKLLVSFAQVVSKLAVVFSIPYPPTCTHRRARTRDTAAL